MSFDLAASATFGADGVATINLGGPPPALSWTIERVSVRTTSATRTAAVLYRTWPTDANQIDIAPASGNGDTSFLSFKLNAGDSLLVQWSGGTPGALAFASMTYSTEPR